MSAEHTPAGCPARPIPTRQRSLRPLAVAIVVSWIAVFGAMSLVHAVAAWLTPAPKPAARVDLVCEHRAITNRCERSAP